MRQVYSLLVLLGVLLMGTPALADSSGQLYGEGLALYRAKRFDDAIEKFQAAYDAKPTPKILVDLGQAHLSAGHGREALFFFKQYLRDDKHAPATVKADVELSMQQAQALLSQPAGQADAQPVQTTVAPSQGQESSPFIAGESWKGRYVCPQGATDVVLRIITADQVHATAIFDFHVPTGVAGKLYLNGTYSAIERRMIFGPGEWINKPAHYFASGLDGVVSSDGQIFKGKMTSPLCSGFALRRVPAGSAMQSDDDDDDDDGPTPKVPNRVAHLWLKCETKFTLNRMICAGLPPGVMNLCGCAKVGTYQMF